MTTSVSSIGSDILDFDVLTNRGSFGGVFIVVTASLTMADGGVCQRFTQPFFLAPHEDAGYFVWTRMMGGRRSARSVGGLGEVGAEPEQEEDGVLPRRGGDGEGAVEASGAWLRMEAVQGHRREGRRATSDQELIVFI